MALLQIQGRSIKGEPVLQDLEVLIHAIEQFRDVIAGNKNTCVVSKEEKFQDIRAMDNIVNVKKKHKWGQNEALWHATKDGFFRESEFKTRDNVWGEKLTSGIFSAIFGPV
ncbi:hypothetical protein CAPTEDRAFT_204275 [Capitella teleta]|uniref:Uncharacterized protein n=1 Tax=Capitella teleta TaxID=283909 RepID=R7U7M0_CAPTE|nr:hypothetical protein CAPTEDRAFT_204275 [Capitella teleta]|eukprot:ELU01934.1 hypothetical protein CAPTEDRAFT_204275 [Capitella teleta]